jgi:hypothetical protein
MFDFIVTSNLMSSSFCQNKRCKLMHLQKSKSTLSLLGDEVRLNQAFGLYGIKATLYWRSNAQERCYSISVIFSGTSAVIGGVD